MPRAQGTKEKSSKKAIQHNPRGSISVAIRTAIEIMIMSNGKRHRMNRAMPSRVGRGGGSSSLLLVSRSCDGPSSLPFGIDVIRRGMDESNCGSEWSMFGAVTVARAKFSESP
jgi:hypothetical protein